MIQNCVLNYIGRIAMIADAFTFIVTVFITSHTLIRPFRILELKFTRLFCACQKCMSAVAACIIIRTCSYIDHSMHIGLERPSFFDHLLFVLMSTPNIDHRIVSLFVKVGLCGITSGRLKRVFAVLWRAADRILMTESQIQSLTKRSSMMATCTFLMVREGWQTELPNYDTHNNQPNVTRNKEIVSRLRLLLSPRRRWSKHAHQSLLWLESSSLCCTLRESSLLLLSW